MDDLDNIWAEPSGQQNPPLHPSQIDRTSLLKTATKIQIVARPYQPNTPVMLIDGASVAECPTYFEVPFAWPSLPPVQREPLSRPLTRASGLPLTWGKPERIKGCFALPVKPDEPTRPNRWDYQQMKQVIL